MSHVAWVRARIKRERRVLPTYDREKLLARSAEVRRCAEIAAFMGDDAPASNELVEALVGRLTKRQLVDALLRYGEAANEVYRLSWLVAERGGWRRGARNDA